jgi:hypothetical protein
MTFYKELEAELHAFVAPASHFDHISLGQRTDCSVRSIEMFVVL